MATSAWVHVETSNAVLEPPPPIRSKLTLERLLRLFENLFINAVPHVLDATNAHLRRQWSCATEVTIRVVPKPDGATRRTVSVYVEYGSGCSNRGASRAADGTGFGLYIVRAIAEAHGWTVRATAGDTSCTFEFDIVRTPPVSRRRLRACRRRPYRHRPCRRHPYRPCRHRVRTRRAGS